jgi:hypothetical protein
VRPQYWRRDGQRLAVAHALYLHPARPGRASPSPAQCFHSSSVVSFFTLVNRLSPRSVFAWPTWSSNLTIGSGSSRTRSTMGSAKRVRKGRLVVICCLVFDICEGRSPFSSTNRVKNYGSRYIVLKGKEISRSSFCWDTLQFDGSEMTHCSPDFRLTCLVGPFVMMSNGRLKRVCRSCETRFHNVLWIFCHLP